MKSERPTFFMQTLDWKKWCADPILYVEKGKTYVFTEEMNRLSNLAKISVSEIEDSKMQNPIPILEEYFHMSFPEIFEYKGKRYMIPETSSINEIRIYQECENPYEWKLFCKFADENCIDIAVVTDENQILLVGSEESKENKHKTRLKIYELKINENPELIPWNNETAERTFTYDSRNGGKIFSIDGKKFRTSQNSTNLIYGEKIHIYEIDKLSKHELYLEHKISEISVDKLNLIYKNKWYKGISMHTYGMTSEYEVIDVNTEHFSLLVPFQKLIRILIRKIKYKKTV